VNRWVQALSTVDQAAEFTRVKARGIQGGIPPSPAISFTRMNLFMVASVVSVESVERARVLSITSQVSRELDLPLTRGYNIVITGGSI
jgi:hypothetical protein